MTSRQDEDTLEVEQRKQQEEDPADLIQTLSLEEITVQQPKTSQGAKSKSKNPHKSPKPGKGRGQSKNVKVSSNSGGTTGAIFTSQGADGDIVRSGHLELNTLYSSNDESKGKMPITVNVCNAPNNSTMQCGCENINCPFCNLMLSIERTDPTVLQ